MHLTLERKVKFSFGATNCTEVFLSGTIAFVNISSCEDWLDVAVVFVTGRPGRMFYCVIIRL